MTSRTSIPDLKVMMERLDNLGKQVETFRNETNNRLQDFRTETNVKLDRLDTDMTRNYITREEFLPVKAIVYGFAGLILAGFAGMLIYIIGWHK